MGSHSVTCHSTQVNSPRLTLPRQAGTRLTYPRTRWPRWLGIYRDGLPLSRDSSSSRARCRSTSIDRDQRDMITTTPRRPPPVSAAEALALLCLSGRWSWIPDKRPPSWFFYGEILSQLTVYSFIRQRVKKWQKNDVVCLCCCSLL